ncbi:MULTISPECIES: 3-hydroxyacyl-CoA dehydrogenase family protein [Micrococcales]|jgi:3-hydroxybutyryl-CoA dehydrogenase|uniref:3-hydroxyacyl-CoA dehydrogenase family protein n=1 Tax=Micrococcales TaxID=85006 RepID=UPI0009AEDAB1|nr:MULTISPECIES: 3-hydroxyacyl-CoA dehydrogenase family protein [Micrococcales]MBT9607692.1 3-hydroxyacyl-CoA dehydrogenase family protein [Microbacterium sp.]MCO7204404.1 3-hydroxyacyl-CoA dehydrogenase family protein [Microbacterium sp. CnD16-F]MDH5134795.1 3-hydroxyacyl-CoA dehydrogenase family protein [Microbacterium sp. RD10]MDH5138355.1 3-hydroxyacyl-CoA dehydrogenase family protein [Microbacterium sp. RD11]MDH5146494.1 3-hydroxyacyl-CoA dehydrogenase family protein [Microbacterium sp. R|tara:strand:- start:2740 stop:3588 length:849 start_codon:yes stop_codon:yes gene_type:complete
MALPNHIAVVGGGRMGAGIALSLAIGGSQVTVLERDAASVDAARARLDDIAQKAVAKDPAAPALDVLLGRLAVSEDYELLREANLVIEAVPEDFELKVNTLRAIEGRVTETTAIATNTSSLSVTKLAAELSHPSRFLGLHFFNPVPASTLIEVVVGEQTGVGLVAAAREWTEGLRKTPVVVHDAPGFASSRLGVALALEAMRMLEEGVASAEDIDAAMVLGYRHATGPLKTTDLVGLDVRLGIAEYLASTLGERFAPPQILRDKVAAGELGRKSGTGFFDYS